MNKASTRDRAQRSPQRVHSSRLASYEGGEAAYLVTQCDRVRRL